MTLRLKFSVQLFFVVVLLVICSGMLEAQLAPEYRRNGECYLLLGEGPAALRGVFRLNNPEKEKYFEPSLYLFTPNNSFTFAVDLNRKIYTFTESVEAGYAMLSGNLKRQVLDTVAANHADYGYHTWIHYDHRSWGVNTAVYRVGPVGRGIRSNGGGTWSAFRSAGPGSSISAPAGNPLPSFSGNLALGVYSGKNWYAIPNGAWYSSWKTAGAVNNGYSYFYVVFGDKEEGKAHNWKLFTWTPNDLNLDQPSYSSSTGSTVAVSYDKKITRQIFAGCLDGCGGASGSGSGQADVMLNDLAFMPPIKTQGSRTYFYSRPEGKSGYEITLNGSSYNPPAANPVIGWPDNTDTFWIGVSMRNVSSDYVYTLGNSVIKNWYTIVTGAPASGLNISAVAVSNQWNQEGGVVYAYDQAGKMLYKFTRKEKDGTPLSSERYQALSMGTILNDINANADSVIDDIKADGFGNLYFALSHPSTSVAAYDPTKHFKLNDAMFLYVPNWDESESEPINGFLIYKQPYGKAVFERNVYDGKVRKIGSKDFAVRYYNVPVKMLKTGMLELAAAGTMPHSKTSSILASWSASLGNNDGTLDQNDFASGCFGQFFEYTYADPGKCRLSVINVPTPPMVHSLGGKNSYLDVIGPYDAIPFYDSTYRHTNQGNGLSSPAPSPLLFDHLYFYMVENYPLPDGAQNPNVQPDWDGDGRMGGFISSMIDPKSSKKGGRVFYRWRTWMVEDLYGNPVLRSLNDSPPSYPADSGQDEYHYFYSPVPGKFIMTCQVNYDWYDYDLLKFGDTIDDLESVRRSNESALPVRSGSITHDPSTSRLNSIMGMEDFKFMTASAAQYIGTILEGGSDNFAVIPLVVGGDVPTHTPIIEVARIQRCDEMDKPSLDNDASWYPQGSAVQPAGGYHGIQAGRSYNWRMDVASQTNLFFDISKSNIILPANINYNYVAHKLTQNMGLNLDGSEVNPFYVNRKPEFQFRNLGGDLKWAQPFIRVTAHLEYKVPNAGGGYKIEKKFLIQNLDKPGEPLEIPAVNSKFPIVTTTGADLPPTDPYDAELVITMRRMFEYNMWLRIWNGTNWIWGSYITLPKDMAITAKTNVKIIDLQKPTIVFSETSPNNLFGMTGETLAAGVGPAGKANPAFVKFTIMDNNPWEAVDNEFGITDKTTYDSNQAYNSSIIDPVTNNFKESKPTAKYNLRPVFAKLINSGISMQLEGASRTPDGEGRGAYAKTVQPQIDDYRRYFYRNPVGNIVESLGRFVKDSQSFYETSPLGLATYRAKITYRLPIENIRIGAGDSRQIPIGYANNTPGYGEKAVNPALIRPYLFYLSVRDASGNELPMTELNVALHVKDVISPFPYGVIEEMKDNTISKFPAADNLATPTYEVDMRNFFALNENLLSQNLADPTGDWIPDKDGKIAKTPFKALKSMGNALVMPFDDSVYLSQIENSLPPRYVEDNVETRFKTGVSDNAGKAVSTLNFYYLDAVGSEKSLSIAAFWDNTSDAGSIASFADGETAALFRGRPEQFPMAVPILIQASDNARDWDYYTGGAPADPANPWSKWTWGSVHWGADAKNARTFKTSLPVFGSKFIIRTIDKSLRNQ